MRGLIIFLLTIPLAAQQGTVTLEPGTPGTIVMTAGNVSCIISANISQATEIYECCTVDGVPTPAHVIPIPSGGYYMFYRRDNAGDDICALFWSVGAGINFEATSVPVGGDNPTQRGYGKGTL